MKVLFIPMNSHGQLNASCGIAQLLHKRGHKIVYAMDESWQKHVAKKGFQHEFSGYRLPVEAVDRSKFTERLIENLKLPIFDQLDERFKIFDFAINEVQIVDSHMKKVLPEMKPDLIIVDTVYAIPSVINSGIPWILFYSISPQGFYKENVPPAFSGYPIDGDRQQWKKYQDKVNRLTKDSAINQWLLTQDTNGVNGPIYLILSKYLNVYSYPKFLDYGDVEQLPDTFFRLDSVVREDDGTELNIPEDFMKKEGKLLYFSFGSFLSSDIRLMQRLINQLGKSKHKFIVSKGVRGDEIHLHENMWGENFLNQIKVLKTVEAVITHGGNNTTVECLHFGLPMIAMPMFAHQVDNAQRIEEKGLGYRLNPFTVEEDVFLETIEKLLANKNAFDTAKAIGEEIRSSKRRELLIEKFEKMVKQ